MDEERESYLAEHLNGLERSVFVVRKKRMSPSSKARMNSSRNEFVEKGGMSDRVESFKSR